MKKVILLVVGLVFFFSNTLLAQGPPPIDPPLVADADLDLGASLFLATGLVYGIIRIKKFRKKTN